MKATRLLSRLFSICLACLAVLSLLTGCMWDRWIDEDVPDIGKAFDDVPRDENGAVIWRVSEDGTCLYKGETVYKQVSIGITLDPLHTYCYAQEISLHQEGYEHVYVRAVSPDAPYVWVKHENGRTLKLFCTDEIRQKLYDFREGEAAYFALFDENNDTVDVPDDAVWRIAVSVEDDSRITRSTQYLQDRPFYYIEAYDELSCLRYTYGMIYLLGDVWYYFDCMDFPYGSVGTENPMEAGSDRVTLYRIYDTAAVEELLALAENAEHVYSDYEYEKRELMKNQQNREALKKFYPAYFVVGFIVPLLLLGLGLVMARTRRQQEKSIYWYVLAILNVVWMMLAGLLLLLLRI